MKRLLYAFLVAVMVLASLFAIVSPVQAIDDPDTDPSVNAVFVYSFSDGSVGVLIDYYLDYAVLPAELASEAYMAVFVDTDGVTQLKAMSPYVFVDSGYGHGVIWIMFTPAEVATYSIDAADVDNYRIWLVGNPTVPSGWTADPPKTISTIDDWRTVGDMSVLLASQILYYADVLELEWSLDLIQETSIGSRLTTLGAAYFSNVISDLRNLAPAVFSDTESEPEYNPIDYTTTFGATATSGTATVTGSPVTLVSGANTITVVGTGTIIFDLAGWTFGDITNGTGTVTGSPADLNPGTNTLTVTGAGTFTVDVEEVSTITIMDASVTGTMWDLTAVATQFGMSRWFFSGLVWMLVTVLICGGVYMGSRTPGGFGVASGGSKVIFVVFAVCIIGGTLLGMLHPLVSSLLFIASGAVIGYVFFFRSETLHKGLMFMIWMFVIVSIAGNVVGGSTSMVATRLSVDVPVGSVNEITVTSTEGFSQSGYIVIGDEIIGYPSKSATTFHNTRVLGVITNPITRGAYDTTETAHSAGAVVRTREASILNSSLDYKIARIADSAGVVGIVTLPLKLLDLFMTFMVLPIGFFGTDLALIGYIWSVVAAGMIFGIGMQLVGGRRV